MIEIHGIRKQDYARARAFAVTGMHFDWYLNSPVLLELYARYFWNMELNRATQVMAAYADGVFVGVLLAEFKGETPPYRSLWRALYVRMADVIQKWLFPGGAGLYEKTTQQMLEKYKQTCSPDGEIIFLAADPKTKIRGIGTALLRELERREKGKTVFLHTDNACTYQFYEHRGFERAVEEHIILDMGKKQVPLECYLYTRTL